MNTELIKSIVDSRWFNRFIIWTIIAAGIVVGVQTYGDRVAEWHNLLYTLDMLILWIFTFEAIFKILAYGKDYFKDAWNIFDFIIVVICWAAVFVPNMNAGYVAVFRLARVLRVLRLVGAMPQLKMLVDAMLKSIPSMGYVSILLFLLFYIYGAMGVFLFGENDPIHFGELGTALVTLFQMVTTEGWADIMYISMYGCDNPVFGVDVCPSPKASYYPSIIYFFSFVLIGTMIVLNLFIGVIMNSMDEVRYEQELEDRMKEKTSEKEQLISDIGDLQLQLEEMKKQLDFVAHRLKGN